MTVEWHARRASARQDREEAPKQVKAYEQAVRCLDLASAARDEVSAEELVNLAWLYASVAVQVEAAERDRPTPELAEAPSAN